MEDESDSDSSVDELKIQQLKEAAVCAESIVTECKKTENKGYKKQMPASLRNLKEKDEAEKKKLENGEQDTGIRLFASSTTTIRDSGEDGKIQMKQKPPVVKRRKLSSSSDSSDEEMRIAEAAISVEQIMKESKTPHNGTQEKSQKTIETVSEKNSEEVLNHVKKKKKRKKKKSEIKIS
uniref:Protein CUSTOS n=1 Tax=Magallana gigas TaxID=29159 RepID=K1PNN2_MAGGI|eukprot:XP_011436694.1 PREDICTED: uncharacterized protein LOC105334803 isoform X2 [Crassostrea gigas]